MSEVECFNCHLLGHLSKDCPHPRKPFVRDLEADGFESNKNAAISEFDGSLQDFRCGQLGDAKT